MSKEICISSTPHETRLAILEDDQLTEVYYERENEYTLAGSIYKGRVTRVLPGMQSAFVDLGLERDAFLYVTDFMEEQEDSSEFERLPGNGEEPARPPQAREARQPRALEEEPRRNGGTVNGGQGGQGSGGQSAGTDFEDGTRRWRGRRGRRRGFRPTQGGGQPAGQELAVQNNEDLQPLEPAAEPQVADARQVPIALPGETLSKYGIQGASPSSSPRIESRAVQPRPNTVLAKPSTLIETPIEWDGEGLLPGESISRYRHATAEPQASVLAELPPSDVSHEHQDEELEIEQEELEVFSAAVDEPLEPLDAMVEEEPIGHEPVLPPAEPVTVAQFETHFEPVQEPRSPTGEFEPDEASASYRVDPAPPSEFRYPSPSSSLMEEEAVEAEEVLREPATSEAGADGGEAQDFAASAPENVTSDSYFDELEEDPEDGTAEIGLVEEEEVTDEEEYDFTPLFAESEDHDLQDLEEETLDQEVAVGSALGELVRDVHIDQRTDTSASTLIAEEEEEEGELGEPAEEADEEEPVAADSGQPARRPRDDQRRGGRGRHDRRRQGGRRQNVQTSNLPIISELLKQGQEILVQIAKEPIAKKGARITSHIALPGRFLVFMPTVNHVGVSRKISSEEERQRLKRILISEKGSVTGGFIVRTAADGASEDDLRADIRFLISLWTEIKQRSDAAKAPALIYHDLNLVERILRDQVSDNFSTIWVDTESEYERIVRFLNRFQPSLVRRVKLYTKETPLFEQFGIQDEISKALKSKVWLKSGGSIVINQTEALVAIDINTGKYVGKTARLEDTILKTNLDAIPEIVRQIRLRDLGGIIVIDFIDMDERKNRNKVMQALEEELKSDRAPSKVLQFNDFGLVAITRKRVKQSLERTLSTQCAICAGTGMVKSPTTVCNEIYIEMRKMQRHLERQDVLLRVHPEVVKALKMNNARWLNELEEMSGKTIIVKSDPALHPEQFDIH